ncbi:MAG: (d)CMP kinase [candidate division Zixibacteria bacterium]|nr:(d)CMP kinase [Candidatus Tariuqbacter arcticus]
MAIDGPAGSGKSTVAKLTAAKLNFRYLDTGAMYRVATLISVMHHIPPEAEDALVEAVKLHSISFAYEGGDLRALLDETDVSDEIRTPALTNKVGPVCEIPGVRKLMGELQRKMGEKGGVVLEGRDIGTVIFPGAEVKIYLDADPEERARRRFKELQQRGVKVDYYSVLNDLLERDQRDKNRPVAPLRKAGDALIIDTTEMSVEEVVNEIVSQAQKYLERH